MVANRAKYEIATSDYVLAESLTLTRMRRGHSIAVELGRRVRESETITVHQITADLWGCGWELFVKYSDQGYSFVDCTSFTLMKTWKRGRAFAFDSDFQTFGFAPFL